MEALQVFLFGAFRILHDGQTLHGLETSKARELLCFLLLHRHRPYQREILADQLWGDTTTGKSMKSLRQALWQLQTALNLPTEMNRAPILVIENDLIHIHPESPLWLDVAEFEQACDTARGRSGKELDAELARALKLAVQLYSSDLLEGWSHEWCLYERERLQNLYLMALDKLMDYCELHQDYAAGLHYGARSLISDRARECTHRRLMRLYCLAGDRTSAIRQYERCAVALQEEFGVKPARDTRVLHEKIRADDFGESEDASLYGRGKREEPGEMGLPDMIGVLRQLQDLLSHIQQQVQQNVRAVEVNLEEEP
jgi:DNA-binding SARP family transcriptional activator